MEQIPTPPDKEVMTFLSTVSLFQGFSHVQYNLILAELEWYQVERNEIFIHEGRPAGSMYLVFKGDLELFHRESAEGSAPIAARGPGDTVGELAIIAGDRRETSVRAKSQAVVARIPRMGIVRLCADDSSTLEVLSESIRHNLREEKLTYLLSTSELFSELNKSARHDLRQALEWIILSAGDVFIRQGDKGDFLGIVVSGQLGIYIKQPDGSTIAAERLTKGGVVGEMSLLTGAPRTATVRATRDSEVVKLSQDGFDRLVRQHPLEMTKAFAGGIIERLWEKASITSKPSGVMANLAVLPVTPDVPIDSFCEQLVRALTVLGTTRYLNSQLVDQALELEGIAQTQRDGINEGRLVAWLNAQEHHYDFVLYQTDTSRSSWSERCIRQADIVLIVGLGETQSSIGMLEETLFDEQLDWKQKRRVLALLHEDESPPKGTRTWITERPEIDGHYHVRQNMIADYERLARYLTGNAVGVVLSGGGARGAAHIGVLQALEEGGIPIDHIGGNSAGAAVAASYALGHSTKELPSLIKQAFSPRNFFDPTIPFFSLFSGRRGANFYRQMLGEGYIEDLWLPFFCVSANLTRAKLVVHDHGKLWRSVLASNSAPGMRPPVVQEGDLLIDGGLLDDLPLDVMRGKAGGGTVIAVDVSPDIDLERNPDYGPSLSGWKILWNRLSPIGKPMNLPPITVILQRANQLSSIRAQRDLTSTYRADLYIRPPVESFSMMDYRAIDEMVEAAHKAAVIQIAKWKSRNGSES
jgi:NTE family protein/lysophospholipid hydrolase